MIQFWNRGAQRLETEAVYGDGPMRLIYGGASARALTDLFLTRKFLSRAYGAMQSAPLSARKVPGFVKQFQIALDEYEGEPYASFNDFFIRKFKPGRRAFVTDSRVFPAPCEARYLAFQEGTADAALPVKGEWVRSSELVRGSAHAAAFKGGACVIARLCPVDYHRFHFPDDGRILERFRVPGKLHSVNPIALKAFPKIFEENEREVTTLETKNFGKVAYVEVGALCVGKIVQSKPWRAGDSFQRGEEKGYFLFGGSTVVLLFEPGRFQIDAEIKEWNGKGHEVYLKLGTPLGRA